MDLEALGRTIERRRTGMGLSVVEAAERSGLSQNYYRSIEKASNRLSGRASRPGVEKILGIASALGSDAAELLELAGYEPALATRQRPVGQQSFSDRPPAELALRIQEAVRSIHQVTPFMQMVLQEQLASAASDINLLASGTFRCTSRDEPYYLKLAIRSCQSHLRAVSYQDRAFWLGDLGAEYLDLHEALAGGVEMTRIFVAPRSEWAELAPTFARHVELGIRTLVVDEDQVEGWAVRDFVIYDNKLLRTASPLADDTESSKTAEFTTVRPQIDEALTDFEYLRTRARPVDEIVSAIKGVTA